MTSGAGRYAVPSLLVAIAVGMAVPSAWPLTALGTSSYDAIDSHLFLWGFWWTKHAVGELGNPYWTDLLLYPSGASLAFHSYPLPYNLVSIPFQYVWPGPIGLVIALNVLTLISFALSALAAYALSVRVTGNQLCGLVAGLVFACMPYRFLNVARLHVLSMEFFAAFLFAWISFAAAPSRRWAIIVAVSLAATYYTSAEYALYAGGFVVVWTLFHWRRWRELGSRRLIAPAAAGAIVLTILIAPLVATQVSALRRGEVLPALSFEQLEFYSPALVSFITPSRMHPFYGSLFAFAGEYGDPAFKGMRSETTIGLTVGVLALVGLWRMTRDGTWFWGVAAAIFFLLTLGPYLRVTSSLETRIPLPFLALYELLPPLRAARDPTRALPMAMLMLSVLAAFGFRACLRQMRTPRSAFVLTAAVVVLVPFESLMPWPGKTPAADLIPTAYQRLAGAGDRSAVIDLTGDHTAMLAQTSHGLPITAGGIANPRAASARKMLYAETDFRNPSQFLAADPATRARHIEADRDMLERFGIRFVVAPRAAPWVDEFATALGLRRIAEGSVVIYER